MRCHYEVLNVSRDADDDEIKKTYRKLALKYHPDKNPDNVEEVMEKFREVQAAYDVLSDKQERAWYDKNREAILRGGDDFVDDALDLMQYFNPGIYSGFDDSEKSFYTVFRDVFFKLNREEEAHDDGSDFDDVEVPDFGFSYSDYDTCVKPFYIYWLAYRTKKSFVWKQQYDVRQAANRPTQRAMERENKKVREAARKKRNDEVRALVMYVRKRDKRVQEEVKKMKLQQEEKQKKMKEIQEQQKQDRGKILEEYEEQAWMAFDDSKLDDIDSHFDQMFGNSNMGGDSGSEDDEEEYLFCVACDKNFKSEKALSNHEKSKKHKENVELIKEQLAEDLFEELHLNDGGNDNDNIADDVNLKDGEDLDSVTACDFNNTKSNSKKSKKKRRKEKKQLYTLESSDEEPSETKIDENTEKSETKIDENAEEKDTKIDEKQEEKDEVIIDSICTSETVPTNDCTDQADTFKDETQISNDLESEKAENKDNNDSSENDIKCNKTNEIKEVKKQLKNNGGDRGGNNDDDDDWEGERETFGCQICTKVFPTRNKLFKHIKAEGHAVLKDGPPSKNKKGKKGKGKR